MCLIIIELVVIVSAGGNANADFIFSTPTKLGPAVNSSAADGDTSISTDGLELFFEGRRSDGHGPADIYVSTRASISDPWDQAEILGPPISGPDWNTTPDISSDGLELYFTSTRSGPWDIWVSTRASRDDPWEEPVNLGPTVNSSAQDYAPSISSDGLSLYFSSDRSGGFGKLDLWVTTRATKGAPWEEPVNLGPTVNSSLDEAMPDISADGRVLFFSDFMGPPQRAGGYGGQDLWMTTRASLNDPWEEPVNLGPIVNSSSFDFSPNISADGSTFYFTSDRGGAQLFEVVDIWEVSVEPIVDLNADGVVDAADMCIIVDHWGTDEPLCDIGPMPWGDGIVDVQDLIVLAEHLFEEIPPVEVEPAE
jgi:Tol biopolymer transport system component